MKCQSLLATLAFCTSVASAAPVLDSPALQLAARQEFSDISGAITRRDAEPEPIAIPEADPIAEPEALPEAAPEPGFGAFFKGAKLGVKVFKGLKDFFDGDN